jgi:hypothetical protein
MRRWVVLPVLAVACGGPGAPPPHPISAPEPVPEPVTAPTALDDASEAPPRVPLETGYGPSPLTPVANDLTVLVANVLDGLPPPAGPIPLERERPPDKLIRGEEAAPRSKELQFLGVAFELEIVLVKEPSPPPAADRDADGVLETIAFVSRTGAKIAALDVDPPRAPRQVDAWLAGAEEQARAVVDAVAVGRLRELLIGEPERSIFDNDVIFRKLEKELPDAEEIRRAEALARSHPRALGVRMDDVIVLGRDRHGVFWGFALQIDEHEGKTVLDTGPLVRVEKLDPREGL